MSEREKALTLLLAHGYLSKNILARFLKSSLKHAGTVLESLTTQEGTISFYLACKDRRITVHNKKVLESVINAIGLKERQAEFYNIEIELKNSFYESCELVYPPADSGIFVQEKRNVVFLDKIVQNKPIVSSVSGVGKNSGAIAIKEQGNICNKQAKIGLIANFQGKPAAKIPVEPSKPHFEVKKPPENTLKPKEEVKKVMFPIKKSVEQETIHMEICESQTEAPIVDIEMVQATEILLTKPNPSLIIPNSLKKPNVTIEASTPVKPSKNSFSDLLSNKNLYTEEEEDSKSSPSKSLTPIKLPQKRLNPPVYKQPQTTNQPHLQANPIKIKKKVVKTRTFTEGGKLITEDYSSEEEVVISQSSFGLGKKQGVQQILNFKIG